MEQRIQVEWQETAEELKQLYKQEWHPQRRTRLQAHWYLRQKDRIGDVAAKVGVGYRSVQNWLKWYRQGGVLEVGRRKRAGAEKESIELVGHSLCVFFTLASDNTAYP